MPNSSFPFLEPDLLGGPKVGRGAGLETVPQNASQHSCWDRRETKRGQMCRFKVKPGRQGFPGLGAGGAAGAGRALRKHAKQMEVGKKRVFRSKFS